MPMYKLTRRFDDGYQEHAVGTILNLDEKKAPSSAKLLNEDEILAAQAKRNEAEEAATRVARDRMKDELREEILKELSGTDAPKQKASEEPSDNPATKPAAKQVASA